MTRPILKTPTTMTKNWKLYIAIALIFAVAGIWYGTRTPPAAEITAAPPVAHLYSQSLPDAQGQQHPLAQFKGKPMVVNFWATWCAPCVQEMPELSQLAADQKASGLSVIGIGIDSPAKIAEFAKKLNIS